MRSSSPAAARSPTRCTSSGATRRSASSAPRSRRRCASASASSAAASCKTYPYEEAFFLPFARQFQAALTTPIILLGGITELATVEAALAEGFAFVAMARALLREPDLPNRMQAGSADVVALHPLQQVHADDLLGHALRPGGRPLRVGPPPGPA